MPFGLCCSTLVVVAQHRLHSAVCRDCPKSRHPKPVDKFRAAVPTDTIDEAPHVWVYFSLDLRISQAEPFPHLGFFSFSTLRFALLSLIADQFGQLIDIQAMFASLLQQSTPIGR